MERILALSSWIALWVSASGFAGFCGGVCRRIHTSLLLFLCFNLSVQSLDFSLKGVELCLLLRSKISACFFGGIYDFLLTEHFLLSLLLFVHRLLPPWLMIFLFI